VLLLISVVVLLLINSMQRWALRHDR
jgi:hypothetical protein